MKTKPLIYLCILAVVSFAGERTYACPYQDPIADFGVSPATYAFDPTLGKYVYYVCVGEVITFDGSDSTYSYDPDSELFSCAYVRLWKWDFYNNDTVDYTADVITHTFGAVGPVDVNLTVTDNDSACCSSYGTTCDDKSDSIMYTVVAVKVEFSPDPLYVCKGGTASLTATVTPSSASSQVDFDTAAPSIATVSGSAPSLTVNGVSSGTTQVRAKLGDCVCETADVTVVDVEIEADVKDEPPPGKTYASGINENSIVLKLILKLNGIEVTPTITDITNGKHIYYKPACSELNLPGTNTVELKVRDNANAGKEPEQNINDAGNPTNPDPFTWSFTLP